MIDKIECKYERAFGNTIYNFSIFISSNQKYPKIIDIIHSPTGNCQVMSMRNFQNLVGHNFTKEEFIRIFKEIRIKVVKKTLLLDINDYNFEYLKKLKLTKKQLFFNKLYTSTNDNKMRILMINLTEL